MNKWQIICPVVALLIAGLAFASISIRNHRRGLISAASRSIGSDLIRSNTSARLVYVGSSLQMALSDLQSSSTHISEIRFGDDESPYGNGTARSCVVLTNEAGKALLIRLRPAEEPGMFHVLGYRTLSE